MKRAVGLLLVLTAYVLIFHGLVFWVSAPGRDIIAFWILPVAMWVGYGYVMFKSSTWQRQPRRVRAINSWLVAVPLALASVWALFMYGFQLVGWES